MKIEVGKSYRTNAGIKVTIEQEDKEHRNVPWADSEGAWYCKDGARYSLPCGPQFNLVAEWTEPDADGWIEWKGGECPVLRSLFVDFKDQRGAVHEYVLAANVDWEKTASDVYQPYAYRLHGQVLPVTMDERSLDATLDERGKRYGKFIDHSHISQTLKAQMRAFPKWKDLETDQAEALEMIQHKIARILNGDPSYVDSWTDIAGYAKLVADRLEGVER